MPTWSSNTLEQHRSWLRLGKLAERWIGRQVPASADRFGRYSARLGPLLVDYSKQRIDDEVRSALIDLAVEGGLESAIGDFFAGAQVNASEGRAALHTALRSPRRAGGNETNPVWAVEMAAAQRQRFLQFAAQVRNGEWRGCTGKPISAVVHIGIGGSHLGPALLLDALQSDNAPEVRFLANIDGNAAQQALAGLEPEATLVIVASKSFSTLETRLNAETVRSWFLERTCALPAIRRHFVAVTDNIEAARDFGLAPENCFAIWDWVGGRYSLWSSVGLPIAIVLDSDGFNELLAGAHLVDQHFRQAPLARNLPAMLALLQIWNTNFHGATTHAVLPYDHRLRLLPDYLQQLEMESNGKSVRLDGTPVATHTAPVIWGGEETNGQHAFHQLLHQGTRAFSADLVAAARPAHDLANHHHWLLANCLAQSKALMEGRSLDDLPEEPASKHRHIAGGHPTTTILLDELTPHSLGVLLALYEHKVFCASVIWQINSFDQWGVELGKELAKPIRDELAGGASPRQDFSTKGLLATIKNRT